MLASGSEARLGGLGQAGIELWFDHSELRGGDAWDSTVRRANALSVSHSSERDALAFQTARI
jgi:hypothetical protein